MSTHSPATLLVCSSNYRETGRHARLSCQISGCSIEKATHADFTRVALENLGLLYEITNKSPLDLKGIKTKVSTKEIARAVRESRQQ